MTKKISIDNSTIWKIVIPILLGNLAQTIISLTDTAFLGRLGEIELGAAAMSGIFYFCFTTLAWGFAIGEQIIVARRFGERRFSEIGSVLFHGMIFIIPFAALLFVVLEFLTPVFLSAALSSDSIYEVSIEFLSYRSFGIFFASINFMFRSFYIGISNTKSIGYTTIVMAVVNIVLDWLLIFGSPFNEPMGVRGAAIASVCAEVSATLIFVLYTKFSTPIKGTPLFKSVKFDFGIIKSIFTLSSTTMLQKMISYGAWITFFILIEKMGERALAVTMVARSAFMLIVMPAFAFGASANTLTSRLIGAGKSEEVLPTLGRVVKLSAITITAMIGVMLINPHFWLGIYTDNVEIVEQTIPIMYQLCFTAYCYCICMIFFEATSGTGHTRSALLIESISLVCYLFVTWLFAIELQKSLFIVWSSEMVYSSTLAIGSVIFMRYYKWQNKAI